MSARGFVGVAVVLAAGSFAPAVAGTLRAPLSAEAARPDAIVDLATMTPQIIPI